MRLRIYTDIPMLSCEKVKNITNYANKSKS